MQVIELKGVYKDYEMERTKILDLFFIPIILYRWQSFITHYSISIKLGELNNS